jgi:hypothetical protein
MVRVSNTQEYKEVEIEDNKQIDDLQKRGWQICGLKSVGKNTMVVLEKK